MALKHHFILATAVPFCHGTLAVLETTLKYLAFFMALQRDRGVCTYHRGTKGLLKDSSAKAKNKLDTAVPST